MGLIAALRRQNKPQKHGKPHDFTFQHKLCHDFESLMWVIVYAMMIRRKNVLSVTDSTTYEAFKNELDLFWGVHSYRKLNIEHHALIGIGSSLLQTEVEETWFPEPCEAAFFRAAMRLVRSQAQDGEPITYENIQGLFRTHIRKAEEANPPTLASA